MLTNSSARAIGFRVTPAVIYYGVIEKEGDSVKIIAAQQIKCPKSFTPPDSLKHIRESVFDLIREHNALFGGIKLIENNSQTKDSFRLNLEGVIQEAFASSTTLKHFFFGAIPKLTGALRIQDKKKLKEIIDGKAVFDHIDMNDFRSEHREALLASLAAITEHGH